MIILDSSYSANLVLKKQNVPIQKRKTKKKVNSFKKIFFDIEILRNVFFVFVFQTKTKQVFFQRGNKKQTVRSQKKRNVDIPSRYVSSDKGGFTGVGGEISFCHDKLSITKILKSMYILAHYLTLVSSINIRWHKIGYTVDDSIVKKTFFAMILEGHGMKTAEAIPWPIYHSPFP